jgi:hypothetical protein
VCSSLSETNGPDAYVNYDSEIEAVFHMSTLVRQAVQKKLTQIMIFMGSEHTDVETPLHCYIRSLFFSKTPAILCIPSVVIYGWEAYLAAMAQKKAQTDPPISDANEQEQAQVQQEQTDPDLDAQFNDKVASVLKLVDDES